MGTDNNIISKIADFILDKTGIYYRDYNYEIFVAKLDRIIKAWKISGYEELFNILIKDVYGERFFDVVNEVAVNVTQFGRQIEHFKFIEFEFIPELIKKRDSRILINAWSAACSTGQEAYHITIAAESAFRNQGYTDYQISVIGSDISKRALNIAEKGIYPYNGVEKKFTNIDQVYNYFQKGIGKNEGMIRIKPSLKKEIEFKYINLNNDIHFNEQFDIVFLRNVLIYFSKEKQGEILNKICKTIKVGGYLFLGYSESTIDFKLPITYIQPSIYKRI